MNEVGVPLARGFPFYPSVCHNLVSSTGPELLTESPAMPTRPSVFVHLLPSLIPPGSLKGGVAVVVDVLRATTAMIHALASGVDAIVPCVEVEEARATAASLGRGRAILGGELCRLRSRCPESRAGRRGSSAWRFRTRRSMRPKARCRR